MQGLEKFPVERQEYYRRLHQRLCEICYDNIASGNWDIVQLAAEHHLNLQRICMFEGAPPLPGGRWACFDVLLSGIEAFVVSKVGANVS